jgi:hypothetical protein
MLSWLNVNRFALLSYTFQDIEKEVRKQVDEAIAQAKVRIIYYFNFKCFVT